MDSDSDSSALGDTNVSRPRVTGVNVSTGDEHTRLISLKRRKRSEGGETLTGAQNRARLLSSL